MITIADIFTGSTTLPTGLELFRLMNAPHEQQAFPMHERDDSLRGMTLRQWYAGQALAGFCANPAVFAANGMCGWKLANATEEDMAGYCLHLAEKMILAESKPATPPADEIGGVA